MMIEIFKKYCHPRTFDVFDVNNAYAGCWINNFGKDWKWIFINLVPFLGWLLWFIWLGFGKEGRGKTNFI